MSLTEKECKFEIPKDVLSLLVTCNYEQNQTCFVDLSTFAKKYGMKGPWLANEEKDFSVILQRIEHRLKTKKQDPVTEELEDILEMLSQPISSLQPGNNS